MYQSNDMRIYGITEAPLRIYGLAVANARERQFYRLPIDMLEKMPQYDRLGRRAVGGRVRFATDSTKLYVKITLACTREDINIPLSGSAGADIYLGSGRESRYLGYVAPDRHSPDEISAEKTFDLSGEMQTVTINLPRNDHLLAMEVGVCSGAALTEAPEYAIAAPIVFYGSSITEGGCAPRAGCAYTSAVCRWLDADYVNFGFSGGAKGEEVFARFIASLPAMSAFVLDYDHNAPSVEHLAATHAAFFGIVRKAWPELPIVMMSRPDADKYPDDGARRRDVVRATYSAAVAAGDKRVWFLDGGEFFGTEGRMECTVDGTHPNALGFMRMAERLYPLLSDILGRS